MNIKTEFFDMLEERINGKIVVVILDRKDYSESIRIIENFKPYRNLEWVHSTCERLKVAVDEYNYINNTLELLNIKLLQ